MNETIAEQLRREAESGDHCRATTALMRQARLALIAAASIIEKVGTTGIEHEHRSAEEWLQKYFPNRV